MKTLGVWFTYGPDGPCLVESVAAFRDALPNAIVAIADDAAYPVTRETLSLVAPDIRHTTDFPRRGNLNGWPAVRGILSTIRRLCRETGAEGAIKIDSDTLVMDGRWLDRTAPMCGFLSGQWAYLFGLAYWLRADAAARIEQGIASRWVGENIRVPEDQTISTEAFRAYGPAVLAHSWTAGMSANWQYRDGEDQRCAGKSVVTFGAKRLAPGKCGDEKREQIALAMAKFRRSAATIANH